MIYLKVTVGAGDNISKAAKEITKLANRLDVIIEFDFNGIRLVAYPDRPPERIVAEYMNSLNKDILGR